MPRIRERRAGIAGMITAGHVPSASQRTATVRDAAVLGRNLALNGSTKHPGTTSRPNAMHDDPQATDVSGRGVTSDQVEVRYFKNPEAKFGFAGMCPCFAVAANGDVLTISFLRASSTVLRLDGKTLAPKASTRIPARNVSAWNGLFHPRKAFQSTHGGTYFFVDPLDRMVIPTYDTNSRRSCITILGQTSHDAFDVRIEREIALPSDDVVIATLPVWGPPPAKISELAPLGYWYVTKNARVGVIRAAGDAFVNLRDFSQDEEVQNSFAVNHRGAFVVTTHALYLVELDASGAPRIAWSKEYDRSGTKLAALTQGSGTTPTLMGDDYVIICDCGPTMSVVAMRQDGQGQPIRQQVFASQPGSECENSVIVSGDRIIVGNTYGYLTPLEIYKSKLHANPRPKGIVCLEIVNGNFATRWVNNDVCVMTSVPKLDGTSGAIYVYTMTWSSRPIQDSKGKWNPGTWSWSLLALDFHNGAVVYEVPIFRSKQDKAHDNAWGTMCLHGDAVYLGMWNGALRIGPA